MNLILLFKLNLILRQHDNFNKESDDSEVNWANVENFLCFMPCFYRPFA